MDDSGIVDEMEPARRSPTKTQVVRNGWEAVVFLVEEIESEKSGVSSGTRARKVEG